jgi:hypothetical protein
MAATLACGRRSALSHGSATTLLQIGDYERGHVEVSIPASEVRAHPGIRCHRRRTLAGEDVLFVRGIPVTSPVVTVIDIAPRLGDLDLEGVVNEAVNRELVTLDGLRSALDDRFRQRGVRRLQVLLDRRTFRLTDSDLERRFLRLVRRAGLAVPETGVRLNGFRVDFYWPDLGLVVETDGLRFHRTPAQQARDRLRDQTHAAAGSQPCASRTGR